MLQDSLGGNTKTVMIANLGPADYNYDETLSTLRYANRAKNIQNKPKINEDPKDAMLREFQEEIARLKEKLQSKPAGGGGRRARSGGGESREEEVERLVEVLREVEVEKLVEVERVIERPVEVEKIVEVFRDINVTREVQVEKLVGMREEEVEALRQQLLEKVRREKEELLNRSLSTKDDLAAQKQTLLEQEARRKAEAEERARIAAEVEELEGKIMHGGVHVRDRVAQQERELAERERQMEEERQKQVRLEQERAKKEEERLATEEKHSSLAEEAAAKGAKLKQLWSKFRAAQAEIDDLQVEQQQEKEDLLHTVRELTRQLQLQTMVIDSFIPPSDVKKLEGRAEWDDEVEEWHLAPLSDMLVRESHSKRPVSHPSFRRPTCDFAKQLMADPNAGGGLRFRGDNLLTLDLDMPERTTADYEVDEVQPNVRAALSAALQTEEELELEAEENLPSMMPGFHPIRAVRPADKPKKKKKPQKSEQEELDELLMGTEPVKAPEESFPESRGLARRR
jgi:kinesin family protein 3/17